ncbi:copper amine oxidase N-terminal domain-containing protein [Paenibacillus sp. MER 99-2]|uniref:copper amine oxidase N-terminal domain-containing protein n=1 Tax=Paenibacillus sp. MER 99-2 TaxID=2939572 RepID=UPI00203C066B|nr:copper amine oxidase N-terminal domain-containing protein [Paenibacillus sp. MER 99-2]MCM3174629.1 copper amine oxidase N-terminal domain-containing protein [Paenibacillus sp. MER 99-2]
MNNNTKKISALMALSLALGGGSALAATPNTTQPAPLITAADQANQSSTIKVLVNGVSIADGYKATADKEPMLALRSLTEALGYELDWNKADKSAELTQGNSWTRVVTGQDQYSVNKMLLTLGAAPEIINGILYVPASFAEKVLHAQVTTSGNTVTIVSEEAVKNVTERGVITRIHKDGSYPSVQIGGAGQDGIVLNLNDDTVFKSAEGKEISLGDLTLGMNVEAVHSTITTRSLPPQTPTYQITVLDVAGSEAETPPLEVLGTAGTVERVQTTAGNTQIEISGTRLTETGPDHVILNITEETQLVDHEGNPVELTELTEGAKVIGFYSPVLTRSLPPIGTAWKVVLEISDVQPQTDGQADAEQAK